ncbi:MAG: YitT family protein [Clostridia bacterium]|nr:YitT family protein [Clostridia bacterium]
MKLKLEYSKTELISQLKNLSLVVIGTLILAFGCAIFVVPFNLVTGGVTGISIIITNAFKSVMEINIDIVIGVITWGLFFLGLLFLGWDFAIKTLASTIIYPPAISLFLKLVSPDVLGGVLDLTTSPHADIAIIISALFGGLCVGTGCAITFLGGGSTGGVDIIAFILCKFFKRWKSSTVIFLIDATTVILGLFVIKDLILTLLGVISAWIAATVIDRIFIGSGKAFTAQIVSDKYEEMNLAIREEVHRTTTMFVAYGGYSGKSKTVLSVTFTMRQYAVLMALIKRIDPTAFVSINRAHEINGEGFTFGEHS